MQQVPIAILLVIPAFGDKTLLATTFTLVVGVLQVRFDPFCATSRMVSLREWEQFTEGIQK